MLAEIYIEGLLGNDGCIIKREGGWLVDNSNNTDLLDLGCEAGMAISQNCCLSSHSVGSHSESHCYWPSGHWRRYRLDQKPGRDFLRFHVSILGGRKLVALCGHDNLVEFRA